MRPGRSPLVDIRGLNPVGAQIEAESTVGANITVVREFAIFARQDGGPSNLWDDVSRYISANGFKLPR